MRIHIHFTEHSDVLFLCCCLFSISTDSKVHNGNCINNDMPAIPSTHLLNQPVTSQPHQEKDKIEEKWTVELYVRFRWFIICNWTGFGRTRIKIRFYYYYLWLWRPSHTHTRTNTNPLHQKMKIENCLLKSKIPSVKRQMVCVCLMPWCPTTNTQIFDDDYSRIYRPYALARCMVLCCTFRTLSMLAQQEITIN